VSCDFEVGSKSRPSIPYGADFYVFNEILSTSVIFTKTEIHVLLLILKSYICQNVIVCSKILLYRHDMTQIVLKMPLHSNQPMYRRH